MECDPLSCKLVKFGLKPVYNKNYYLFELIQEF